MQPEARAGWGPSLTKRGQRPETLTSRPWREAGLLTCCSWTWSQSRTVEAVRDLTTLIPYCGIIVLPWNKNPDDSWLEILAVDSDEIHRKSQVRNTYPVTWILRLKVVWNLKWWLVLGCRTCGLHGFSFWNYVPTRRPILCHWRPTVIVL